MSIARIDMKKTAILPGMWGDVESDEIDELQMSYGVVTHRPGYKKVIFSGTGHPEHGIYDFYSYFGTGDMHQWYVNDIGVPWENEKNYHTMSSLHEIDQVDTPLLITAGENDSRTPLSQAEQLYISAKRADVEAKLIRLPGRAPQYLTPWSGNPPARIAYRMV